MSQFTAAELETLKSARALLKRKARSNFKAFTQPDFVKDYLMADNVIREPSREEFRVLYLDSQHRLIADVIEFQGTLDACGVFPRTIVQNALGHNAKAVIISHNHPSGVAEPSNADRTITKRIKEVLDLVDINLLDHIVVGDGETIAFSEKGWMY